MEKWSWELWAIIITLVLFALSQIINLTIVLINNNNKINSIDFTRTRI